MNFLKIKRITGELDLKKVVFNCDTSKLCSIGAGGRSAALIIAEDTEKLLSLIEAFEKSNIKYLILGGGTNIVFGVGPIEHVLIKLGRSFEGINIESGKKIEAGAAAGTSNLTMKAARHGFDLTFLAGIPGTIGGAICGNSGTSGQWISGCISILKYISRDGNRSVLTECSGKEIRSGYRYFYIPGLIAAVSVILEPVLDDPRVLISKISRNMMRRKSSQPAGSKTSGCFFKNPAGDARSAGALIEKCGLKGLSYGGARVSAAHANFIENFRSASSEDIIVLSRIIKSKVIEKYDIDLEYEVKLIG